LVEAKTAIGPTNGLKRIAIDPVTRVEGHGKVTILLDAENRVKQARLHIVEFRGFERFIQGRLFWEIPVIVQRLCGICPVSHHLAGAKAMDVIVGGEKLTPTAEKVRRLMHYGQTLQSHALHFFHLCSPDLLFGFDADPAIRNVIGVAAKHPELAKQGILLRKYGQELIKATAGKKIHGTGAIPGGVNKNISIGERDVFLKDIEQIEAWGLNALKVAKDYTVEHLETLAPFGSFESNHLSLVRADGAMDLYDGNLRAIDATGAKIFDQVAPSDYLDYIAEDVRPWSYMKFPFIKSIGPDDGWYRVGPLARVNACDFIDTPLAEAARKEFLAVTDGKPNNITMAYHWARMIELVHSIEKIKELLHDADLQGTDLVVKGERRSEGIGLLEAPRGTLFHHYKVDEHDQITMANLIVSTTNNNEPMNRAVQRVAEQHISGKAKVTEGLLNHVEVAIRAYDPCLSCATHALGRMPLIVELVDHEGNLVETRTRG
jgi:NAD-reducing hydrogenase large subunit